MRAQMSATKTDVFSKVVLGLACLTLATIVPRRASAQGDAIRIMAERVLGQTSRDRNDEVWGNRDELRRDGDRMQREQREREMWCTRHRYNRKCDNFGRDARRGGEWCLDRDRNGRCDVNGRDAGSARGRGPWQGREEDVRGRGRGPWSGRDDDDRSRGRGRRRG